MSLTALGSLDTNSSTSTAAPAAESVQALENALARESDPVLKFRLAVKLREARATESAGSANELAGWPLGKLEARLAEERRKPNGGDPREAGRLVQGIIALKREVAEDAKPKTKAERLASYFTPQPATASAPPSSLDARTNQPRPAPAPTGNRELDRLQAKLAVEPDPKERFRLVKQIREARRA